MRHQKQTERRLSRPWAIEHGGGPVLAVALHAGHEVTPEAAERLAIPEELRLREEDPGTERFTGLGVTRVVVRRSRFQVDLNRPREGAVYRTPETAWGLEVWRDGGPPDDLVERSLEEYDAFYDDMEELLSALTERWGRVAVYDLHSYNHRRSGPEAPPDDPERTPEVNVGTGRIDRGRWAPVVERFIAELACCHFYDRRLDVRENVRFLGGHFPAWVARTFPRRACPLAIEVKKVYMDEWTGEIDGEAVEEIREALEATVPGVTEVLRRLSPVGPKSRAARAEPRTWSPLGLGGAPAPERTAHPAWLPPGAPRGLR